MFRDHIPVAILTSALGWTLAVLFHVFSTWTVVLALVLGIGVGIARFRHLSGRTSEDDNDNVPAFDVRAKAGLVSVHLLQAALLAMLFLSRTDQGVVSPWKVLPASIFPLYALTLLALMLINESLPGRFRRFAWFVQCFIAFSTSAIIYRLGFGFDPFIHQAAVRSLVTHNDIQLPSILYVGQYALEGALVRLTRVSIRLLDPFLLPVLGTWASAYLVPKALRLWKSGLDASPWPILLLTFAPFTFTVPYYGAHLALFVGIVLLPHLKTRSGYGLAFLLSAFALFLHPLLAIPLIVLIGGAIISERFPKLAGPLAFVATLGGLAVAFAVYVHQLGGTIAAPNAKALSDAWHIVTAFPFATHNWAWYVTVFYKFFHVWPWLMAACGWYGYRFLPDGLRPLARVLVGTAAALFIVALGLAASVRFENIASTEQFEFALRLRAAIPVLFLPGLFLLADRVRDSLTHAARTIAYGTVAAFCGAIWYLSYPQANVFVMGSVPGLSATEIRVVQKIESLSGQAAYAALTPQMVSAAALQQIGFERSLSKESVQSYPYAIPTGGALYKTYMGLWKGASVTSTLQDARSLTNQTQIFIVLPYSWDPTRRIHYELDPLATASADVDGTYGVYRFE